MKTLNQARTTAKRVMKVAQSYMRISGTKVAIRICTDPEEEDPILLQEFSKAAPEKLLFS